MRGNEFLDKLELVDPAFIAAADELPTRKRAGWLQWGGLAACLCVIAAAVFSFSGKGWGPNPSGIAPEPSPSQDAAPTVTAEYAAPTQPDAISVDMGKIFVNEMEEAPASPARLYYDPEQFDVDVRWDSKAVTQYYGRVLAPSCVPEGLTPTNPDGSALVVIRREDGAVAWDTIYFGFYQLFGTWDNGSPRFIDENCVQHGIQITASRLGLMGCCVYRYDEVKQSDIAGVPVTIGYRPMSYGPYDPDTHTPAGYYDLYVVEFTLDGIQFKVTAEEMELDEVVKVAASIICPDCEIVLKR